MATERASAAAADYTGPLRQLMAEAGIASFRALAQAADVSEWAIRQIRAGRAGALRLELLVRISQVLNVTVADLVSQFVPGQAASSAAPAAQGSNPESVAALQEEYSRLQAQLADQRQQLQSEFQSAALSTLESWLLQWPTAAYAAQQNEQVPAVRLLPLMKPMERLLEQWRVVAIAPVGSEVPYDPTQHQLMEGTAQPGDLVRVRYTGYWQGEKLLYRAKVSPVPGAPA